MAPQNLREQLLRDEDVRLKAYQDSVGKWTIGVGRNLQDKGISLREAEFLLDNDITDSAADVSAEIPWSIISLDEVRREVLINMSFNMGIGSTRKGTGLLGFKDYLAALQAHLYEDAAREMLNSKWARQVGPRAHRLAEQIRSGSRQ